jgi:hypothetical protein
MPKRAPKGRLGLRGVHTKSARCAHNEPVDDPDLTTRSTVIKNIGKYLPEVCQELFDDFNVVGERLRCDVIQQLGTSVLPADFLERRVKDIKGRRAAVAQVKTRLVIVAKVAFL